MNSPAIACGTTTQEDSLGAQPVRPAFIKGGSYKTTRLAYDKLVPGGWNAVLAASHPSIRAFANQPFLASSWYPIEPSMELDYVACDLMKRPRAEGLEKIAQEAVAIDVRGPYAIFLRVFSSDAVLNKLVTFSSQYVNFGTPSLRQLAPHEWEVTIRSVPTIINAWYNAMTAHWTHCVLLKSGAKNLTTKLLGPQHTSRQETTVRFCTSWT